MTPTQLAAFIKMTQSASVRGQIQEDTPEGWELQVGGYEYKDCVNALRIFLELSPPAGVRGPWINAVDIKTQVRKVRRDRTDKADVSFVPPADADDIKGYIQALRSHRKTIADGEPMPELSQLDRRFNPETLLKGVFKDPGRIEGPKNASTLSPRAMALLRKRADRV